MAKYFSLFLSSLILPHLFAIVLRRLNQGSESKKEMTERLQE